MATSPAWCAAPSRPAAGCGRIWWACTPAAPPVNVRPDPDDPVPYTERKGAVLIHILEELFQHCGQMELTRDALVASRRR